MFELLDFNENPNLGVYCRSNNTVAFIQHGLLKKIKKKVQKTLEIKLIELSIAESTIVGSLLAMNSAGAVVTDICNEQVIKSIKDEGLQVFVITDKINAAGNDILVNDSGAIVHPDITDEALKQIEKTFNVPVKRGTIASLKTVGMAATVTNKGCLCHPKVSEDEKQLLEDVLKVSVMIGTVNHGHPMIGSGLVANIHGAIIGNKTTGIEMGRIEEALGFLD